MKKRATNYYHNKLLKLGEKVMRDEEVAFSHLYYFGCGCIRTYSVNPIFLTDREMLQACEKHDYLLKEGEAV